MPSGDGLMVPGAVRNTQAYTAAHGHTTAHESSACDVEKYLPPACPSSLRRKVYKLMSQGRSFYLLPSPARGIVYYSKKPSKQLNGRATVNGEPVVCRHLAYAYAKEAIGSGKDKFEGVDTVQKISVHPAFQHDYYEIFNQYYPKEAYYFSLNHFPEIIYQLAENFWQAPSNISLSKNYLLYSPAHAMAIRFNRAKGGFVITVYDPNGTTVHRKIALQKPDDIKQLKLSHFLDKDIIDAYFKGVNPTGCITGIDVVDHPEKSTTFFVGKPSSSFLHFALSTGFLQKCSDRGNEEDLPLERNWAGEDAMRSVKFILENKKLTEEEKVQHLLIQEQGLGPSLHIAFSSNRTEAILAFSSAVLDSDLSPDAKVAILQTRDEKGIPALMRSFIFKSTHTTIEFCRLILESNLSLEHKIQILQAETYDGETGFYGAIAIGDSYTVGRFAHLILESQLPIVVKKYILQAVQKGVMPGLNAALEQGDPNTVLAFCLEILSSDLPALDQVELILAACSDGTMKWSHMQKYPETLDVICHFIEQSQLPAPQKTLLLMVVRGKVTSL